ncbi:MAG: hypothetical protein R2784_17200 [Saprospiraceae bacterium]
MKKQHSRATLAEPMVLLDNCDDLSIDFGLVSLDYGDLPDTLW